MKVRPEPAVEADANEPARSTRWSRVRPWVVGVALAAVVVAAIFALYLSIYPAKGFATPLGYDTPEYVWRTKLAQQVGLSAIDEPIPSLGRVKRGRPGYPAVAGTVSSLEGVDPFELAKVLPVAAAAGLALAAGAFAGSVLRRNRWEVGAIALAVGASPFMALFLAPEGYVDTIIALALFVSAAVFIARLPDDGWALVPAMGLLGVAGLVHFQFFALMLATLALVGLVWLPESWRRWRSGSAALWETPAARVGLVAAGGSVLSLGLLYGLLGNAIPKTRSDVLEFKKKLARDLPEYRFSVTGPLATGGAAAMTAEVRRDHENRLARTGLVFLLAWGLVVLAGYLAGGVFHLRVPAHRFLSFALCVPILGAVAVLWAARWLARQWLSLGVLLVVAGLALSAWEVHGQWFENRPWIETSKIEQAGTVAAYLQATHVPIDRPVVFIVGTKDPNGAGLMGHEIRAAVPAERIRHTYLFVGSAEDFLARRAEPDPVSELYLRRMAGVFDQDPVAVITSSYNDTFFGEWTAAHPDSIVDQDVAVVQGPPPTATVSSPPAGASVARVPPVWSFGLTAVGAFLVLAGAGLGWSLALPRRWISPLEALALAPTLGIGALIVATVLADRAGFRPAGVSGALTPVAVAVAGGAFALWMARRRAAVA